MRFFSFIVASIALSYSSTLVSADLTTAQICQQLQLVNAIRAGVGKAPYKLSKTLSSSAQAHSDYQQSINSMTHNDPRGDLGQRIESAGFPAWSCVSENVASGQTSVSDVVTDWKNSPGHYANIISNAVYAGFGLTGTYWSQEFAAPLDTSYNDDYDICNGGSGDGSNSTNQQTPDQQAPDQQAPDQAPAPDSGNNLGYLVKTYINGQLQGDNTPPPYYPNVIVETQTVTVHDFYHKQ